MLMLMLMLLLKLMLYLYIKVSKYISGLGASKGAAWHRTHASATLALGAATALNVSRCHPDKDDFDC